METRESFSMWKSGISHFFRSFAIVANCESAAWRSSTMEFAGAGDMDGKPEGVNEWEFVD